MGIRLKKVLTAAGLIVVTILGGVALSLAHEDIPSETAHALFIGHGASHGLSHPGEAARRARLEWETCDAPTVVAYAVQDGHSLDLSDYTNCDALATLIPCAPKVSLYMLDSVLLI